MRIKAIIALAIVVAVNFGAWYALNRPVAQRSWDGMIASVSFTPYQADQGPHDKKYPSVDQIDRDMALVSRVTDGVRTYDALNGFENIPRIAAKYGLNVIAGAAVNGNRDGPNHDDMEISSLIDMWKHNKNVKALIVSNEQVLTNSLTPDQVIAMIKKVKDATRKRPVPVFACENATPWFQHPELVEASDFICVHILPYWDSIPADQAIDQIFKVRKMLADKYPGKPIILGEVGWPSEGPWLGGAEPSRVNQATFIRNFLNRAREEQLDEPVQGIPGYNVVEAFDQPWKRTDEQAYTWGLFDAQRNPKFQMSGPLVEIRNWKELCAYSSFLALPIVGWFLWRRKDINAGGLIFFPLLIQATASLLVWTWGQVNHAAYDPGLRAIWYTMISMQVVLFGVILADGLEITELMFRSQWRRLIKPKRQVPMT